MWLLLRWSSFICTVNHCMGCSVSYMCDISLHVGQLFVYDCNDVLPVCETVASKDRHSQVNLSWSLDSNYVLSVASDVCD